MVAGCPIGPDFCSDGVLLSEHFSAKSDYVPCSRGLSLCAQPSKNSLKGCVDSGELVAFIRSGREYIAAFFWRYVDAAFFQRYVDAHTHLLMNFLKVGHVTNEDVDFRLLVCPRG